MALTASSRFQSSSDSSTRRDVDDAGVVDEHVQALAVRHERLPARGVGDVEPAVGDVEPVGAQARGGLLARLVEHVDADHVRALARSRSACEAPARVRRP